MRAAETGPSPPRVLVVDDEPQILQAVSANLRAAGFRVDTASSVATALSAATSDPPDALILDLVLPDGRGTDVCRELRGWYEGAILVLSVIGEEREKVAALDAGADDYVVKPFGVSELLARLRAALRRTGHKGEPLIEVGELHVDLERRKVTVAGRLVHLTPNEFNLLRLLAINEDKLVSQRTILREVWGPAYSKESHYLHVYVSQLRRKIEADPTRPRYILTETGVGYRLVNPLTRGAQGILREP